MVLNKSKPKPLTQIITVIPVALSVLGLITVLNKDSLTEALSFFLSSLVFWLFLPYVIFVLRYNIAIGEEYGTKKERLSSRRGALGLFLVFLMIATGFLLASYADDSTFLSSSVGGVIGGIFLSCVLYYYYIYFVFKRMQPELLASSKIDFKNLLVWYHWLIIIFTLFMISTYMSH